MNESAIGKEEVHAFIDGELDPARAAEVEKLSATDADLARQIAAFRSDKERLDQIYGVLRDLPLPPKWREAVEDRPSPKPPASRAFFPRWTVTALAASLLLVLGLGFAYERFVGPREDPIIAEAFAARQDATRPEQSYAADAVTGPEARNQVIATALMMTLQTPDLSKLGYQLADIRIYSDVPGGKAVELSYRNAQNRLFTLYLRHPSSPPRVDLIQQDGVRICIWQDDVLGTVMLGEMSAGEMARIASLAYSGLTS